MFVDIKEKLSEAAALVEAALEEYFSSEEESNKLTDAMKYSLLGGGKRIRAFREAR